ncbi:MAG: transcriptional regulator [Elusimicrobia bacterium GWA2_69_24]|nr:MAG: transcriptional regulator [Elusimicrobia bacterium GWA2_69_24]HBL18668.1 transcriptional regulator [Elusimicrobiota bacterium]
MPEISRFLGIVIAMFYDDHNPPHFHARYGGNKAAIVIRDFSVMDGSLPPRVMGLVMEWAAIHRAELERDWENAKARQPLVPIAPLE